MQLAVKLYGPNDQGLPETWPADVRELKEGDATPQGFLSMSDVEYEAYRTAKKPEYDSTRAPVELARVRQVRKDQLKARITDYIESHYGPRQQATLNALLTEGLAMGYTLRVKYIAGGLVWVKSAIRAYYAARDAIDDLDTVDAIKLADIDFKPLEGADPRVDVEIAMGMES